MSLELKKKQMELKRVTLAKEELELKIEEKLVEIGRLKDAIKTQENTEIKLEKEIFEMKEN
jgi:hypothetical protein